MTKFMFSAFVIVFTICFFNTGATFAQDEMEDVVYFEDGAVVRGKILELNTTRVIIETKGGQKINRSFKEVHTISEEKIKAEVPYADKTKARVSKHSSGSTYGSAKGHYVSGNIGLAMASDSDLTDSTIPGITVNIEYDTGLAFGLAVGYDFGNTRVEGEIAYQKNDFNKMSLLGVDVDLTGDVTLLSLLVNGYYDFANSSVFTPYISGGLGFAKVEINDLNVPGFGLSSFNDDDTVFAYQIGLGVGYAVNEKVTIDTKYRYFATSDIEFDTTETEFASHNFLIGVRVSF